jgi:hypothetical protein
VEGHATSERTKVVDKAHSNTGDKARAPAAIIVLTLCPCLDLRSGPSLSFRFLAFFCLRPPFPLSPPLLPLPS